jgi:cell fate regulator YaaT (PSP1 superfamily)
MADGMSERSANEELPSGQMPWQLSVEEAREQAKARFRDRLANSEEVGGCSCSSDDEAQTGDGPGSQVVGVRFRDSGRVFFFQSHEESINVGDWVACGTSRGLEAGRVVVAPKQVLMSQLDGELKPIERVLDADDVDRMERYRDDAAKAVRLAGEISRSYDFGIKAVSAEYALDGESVRIAFSASDHSFVEDLRQMLVQELGIDVYLLHVGPRDEARLIGGLGKCGRTLCCSSWLPMYPEVSMGMAKNQDLSLNPTKVSGLCGRLLCCLSYENEQYKKVKQILPRLGQRIETPDGEGMVVSLQVLKELVTVRFTDPYRDETYPASELLSGARRREGQPEKAADVAGGDATERGDSLAPDEKPRKRRRRRGRRTRSGDEAQNAGSNEN